MENTKIIQLLKTFSKKDLRDLRKFIQSPFFNQRKDVIQLLDILLKSLKKEQFILSKIEIAKTLYPNEPFDDHKVRMVMSFLLKNAEQFLVINDLFQDNLKYKAKLTGIYRQRNLPKHFEKTYREISSLKEKQNLRNADFHATDYEISMEAYRFHFTRQPMSELNLQELSDKLDTAFIARKLWQTCLSLSHQAVYNKEYQFGLLREVLDYIEKRDLFHIPAISIYYHWFHALTDSSEQQHFQRFKQILLREGKQFPKEEIRDLYILAINFCIKQYNAGNLEYLKEQFDFYQEGFKSAYFLQNGVLSRFTYQNAVTIGLVMKEFDWVENVIFDYQKKLKVAFQETVFNFNMARLKYEKQDYNAALNLLQQSEYKDLYLNLAAKTLQLKIYYELDEFDLLEAHLGAMRTFIRRKKDLGYHRENYLNTLHFTKKMVELIPFDKEAKKALNSEVEQTNALAEKRWILGQLV